MDMIILDFSKAFDKVPHQRLISKLQFYGIQGSTLTWIKSWLTSRSQSVIIDGVSSKSVDVTSGVPQGTVLGPLMFLLFINDMQNGLGCTLRLFADDALLYHKITHHDDTLALQRDLDKLGQWANRWQMLFNPSKCYKMSVFRSRSPVVKGYTLYNQTLVSVRQHHYLGVLLSSDLRWNTHVDKIAKKGNSSLAFVKRNLYACSEETKRAAYVSLVRPHLEYASAVWDPYRQNQVEKLEAIQSRATIQMYLHMSTEYWTELNFSYHANVYISQVASDNLDVTTISVCLVAKTGEWKSKTTSQNCQALNLQRKCAVVSGVALETASGENKFSAWDEPKVWHVLFADSVTCDPSVPALDDVAFTLEMLNPDSGGKPTNHCGCDETGILSFYEVLAFLYFAGAIAYGQRLWQTIQKGGPMHLVIKMLSIALIYQGTGHFLTLIHIYRYSKDGEGYPLLDNLSTGHHMGFVDCSVHINPVVVQTLLITEFILGGVFSCHQYTSSSRGQKRRQQDVQLRDKDC
ncbi:Integral membrane protein GPR180 [Stylophora pistillata]|uniref:Integral membrane protein GPR180 n=1 Tax=Stylophora pistillata TaxID=50429 RepID=A0A2B4SVP1_STYPI|nr:Integral membrane protein GPR180 [Stylophora pistillata]